jgi:hypothetical protein
MQSNFADLMPCKNVLIHLKVYLIDEEFSYLSDEEIFLILYLYSVNGFIFSKKNLHENC